jgi:hypothetical protein
MIKLICSCLLYTFVLIQCVIEFEFRCTNSSLSSPEISFQYIWGSEEYPYNIDTPFNDVFAFFLNNENIAKLSDGTNVGISSVNHHNNSQLFISNNPSVG